MADINILMMGGRRAGKTSILAALDECCSNKLSDVDNISVFCTEGGGLLSEKSTELATYFTDPTYTTRQTFVPDQTPTDNPKDFLYQVDVGDRNTGYTLKFTDVPGEYYEQPQHFEEVQAMVNKSHVILIAIDTPHMAEDIEEATGVGEAHFEFNRVYEISRFFKSAFQNNKQPRLVIFVPLKCEKYYYRNKLKQVNQLVKKGYESLLETLSAPDIKALCTVAIMPICTIGGAEFFRFHEDKRSVGDYNYVRDSDKRHYRPEFCEQPLFLTLRYLITLAEQSKKKQWKIYRLFSELLGNAAKLDDLTKCKDDLTSLLRTDAANHFELIQDPMGIMK